MKLIFWLVFIQSVLSFASQDLCFEEFSFKEKFNFFEIRSNKRISVNSFYRESLARIYSNIFGYTGDEAFEFPNRNRDFVLIHMSDEEFAAALESLKGQEIINRSPDYHSNLKQISYRMYVNHDLNKACQKDFIFIRNIPFVDRNFLHQVAHEMFHILRGQSCGKCTNKLWLEEGLAEYVASKTSSIRPDVAISAFINAKDPISFFELDPNKYQIANYGQSYLFLDFIFRNDVKKPEDVMNNGFLKQFIQSGETSCEIIRNFFEVSIYPYTNLTELPCESWFIHAYKEFIYNLIDPNVSRGGVTTKSLGDFPKYGTLPKDFSFVLLNVTDKVLGKSEVLIQSSGSLEVEYHVKTSDGHSLFLSPRQLENVIKEVPLAKIHLLLMNYSNSNIQYRVDFKDPPSAVPASAPAPVPPNPPSTSVPEEHLK